MTWLWAVAALYGIPIALWLLIPGDNRNGFWTGLYERHVNVACCLWGFTHIFGPRLQDSDWWPQAFERKMRERGL